ncbi:Metallopeptidase ImmA [bioreactor metagenome]|uniref:Metallopeptidase ImmA n=1 Tax=bioreactor metagenome TaxID=1076179 RepID=A0A645I6S8_9ZZZZ
METKAIAVRLVAKHHTRNPFRIADAMGFIVVLAPLVDMRGFQQRTQRRNIIYINQDLDEQQQGLVCAHELGHHLLHRGLNRMFMDHSTRIVTQKFENEAHQLSLELVYSDEELNPFLTLPIVDAAAYMGVPVSLANRRMSTVQPTLWAEFE